MPGTLTTADLAILGSLLAWTRHESDTGRIAWQSDRYRILSDGDNPRYWTATVRLDRDRVHLGAGAGDIGLAKCVRLAERHAQTNSGVGGGNGAAVPVDGRRATESSMHASREHAARSTAGPTPDPFNKDLSPQQQQLL